MTTAHREMTRRLRTDNARRAGRPPTARGGRCRDATTMNKRALMVRLRSGCEEAATVTVKDVLDGHVVLDVECLERIYLNGYVPNLQVSGQVSSL